VTRRPLPFGPLPLVAVLAAGLAACGAPPAAPGATAPATTTTASGVRPTSTAFSIDLPAGVTWVADGDRRVASGARIRRWRFQPPGHGPACVVSTGELVDYRGAFPAVQLAAFAGSRESGAEVIRNESITPPAGSVAAITQEQSFVSQVVGAGTVRSHLYVRQALTVTHTLVAVYAAGPDDAAADCRPQDTAASLHIASPTGGSTDSTGGSS
jgi:hypothetical protein